MNEILQIWNNISDSQTTSAATPDCGCISSRHFRHRLQCRGFDSPQSLSSQQTSSPIKNGSDPEYLPSASSFSSSNADLDAFDSTSLKGQSKAINFKLCYENSKIFLGIDQDKLSILPLLRKHLGKKESERDVLIVLRKIKLNESFDILGLYFGLSASHTSRIFDENLPKIAKCLRTLIFKPPKGIVHCNLPASFRANYYSVSEIIDAFEVETEKPGDAVHQALTWSDYKHCNTFKFLVSCTPDGHINKVSKAYGGRISDLLLAIESGYVAELKENTTILADRGFKFLEAELAAKSCKLLRPPSISGDSALTAEQSLVTKQIAALRIHVERVIGRLRDFACLAPHARVDHNMISKLDDIAVIAAGLVNLQNKITRY